MLTIEYVAACDAERAAKALNTLAYNLRDIGTPQAESKAKEAAGAARLAMQWRRELLMEDKAKQRACREGNQEIKKRRLTTSKGAA